METVHYFWCVYLYLSSNGLERFVLEILSTLWRRYFIKSSFWNVFCALVADAKSTPCYSSDLHFSVFQNRPYRGALIYSKICSKSYDIRQKVENGIYLIKKFWQWCCMAYCLFQIKCLNIGPRNKSRCF